MAETDVVDNALDGNWYDNFAGDDEGRVEQLSKFESFDDFLEDYQKSKDFDWRGAIAGDDDKFKSKLERFAEPADFGKTYREAEQKIRTGDVGPQKPGEDATDDEIKEYRKQIGVPLEADGYLKDLPDGLVLGDDDKEIFGTFAELMHSKNAPPEYVHGALEWYNGFQEQQQEQMVEMDKEQSKEAIDALRDPETGWGKDYRTNMALVDGLLKSTFGEEASEQLLNGRYADGRGFFNDVNVLKGLATIARQLNPVGTIIPNDTNAVQSMEDEIAEIEAKMGTAEYKKDEKMQARYRELVDARLSLQKKSAA